MIREVVYATWILVSSVVLAVLMVGVPTAIIVGVPYWWVNR